MIKPQNSFNRMIGILPLNGSILTRTRNFVPDYAYTDKFVDTHFFDEIVILKIDENFSKKAVESHAETINRLMGKSALPLTLGGNIRSIADAAIRFEWGADRVMLGKKMMSDVKSLRELVSQYGSQAIVGCINYDSESISHEKSYCEEVYRMAHTYQELGIGELMLTAIDRDGTLQGFDQNLPNILNDTIEIPIVLNGGLGNWTHIETIFLNQNIAGVCTSNILHLSTSAIKSMKETLYSRGVRVRREFHQV